MIATFLLSFVGMQGISLQPSVPFPCSQHTGIRHGRRLRRNGRNDESSPLEFAQHGLSIFLCVSRTKNFCICINLALPIRPPIIEISQSISYPVEVATVWA
jgi:hypothetical protein